MPSLQHGVYGASLTPQEIDVVDVGAAAAQANGVGRWGTVVWASPGVMTATIEAALLTQRPGLNYIETALIDLDLEGHRFRRSV